MNFELNLKRQPIKRINLKPNQSKVDQSGVKLTNWTKVHLIGPNKNYLIIMENKLSLTNFREKIIYYITVQNNYLFPRIA